MDPFGKYHYSPVSQRVRKGSGCFHSVHDRGKHLVCSCVSGIHMDVSGYDGYIPDCDSFFAYTAVSPDAGDLSVCGYDFRFPGFFYNRDHNAPDSAAVHV